jgi:hypothetical protein
MLAIAPAAGRQVSLRILGGKCRADQRKAEEEDQQNCRDTAHP